MRILLLSSYDALSHRYWHSQLVARFSEYQWTVLTLAPRYFSFRVRSNPLSWHLNAAEPLSQSYDLIIATSLVDIATLRGLFPNLASTPLWFYCHENQFAYPASRYRLDKPVAEAGLEAKMVFIYGCLCADAISFNSQWNLASAMRGMRALLKKFPEKLSGRCVDTIQFKSDVLPVPLAGVQSSVSSLAAIDEKNDSEWQLLWNHRWEYDKGPEHLLSFVRALIDNNIRCRLHIVGQSFRQQPDAFTELQTLLKEDRINASVSMGYWGYIESLEQYRQLLVRCDIVVSTALHDFQGIAVMEAVHSGCVPLLPDQQVYPELFNCDYLYSWDARPVVNAQAMLEKIHSWMQHGLPSVPGVATFDWENLHIAYQTKIQSLTRARKA